MKTLFVVHDYPPEHVGDIAVHTHALARELVRRGHRVSALFTKRDPGRRDGDVRRGQLDGVNTIEVVHRHEHADARDAWLEPHSRKVFAELLAEERPEIVHFQHIATWGAACLHVARAQGCGVVFSAHDFHLLCANSRAMTDSARLCLGATGSYRPDCTECVGGDRAAASERRRYHVDMLRRAQRVICPSQFVADVLLRNGLARSEQLALLVQGVEAPQPKQRIREAGAALQVGCVGELVPAQGVHVLIDALRQIGDAAIELHVHGELDRSPEYAASLRAAAGSTAPSTVHFHGRFEPSDSSGIFESFDLLACPSLWYECAPLAITSAFSHGVPVLATKLGAMAEIVRDDVDGLLVGRNDSAALATALRRLATEAGLLERLASGVRAGPTIASEAEQVEQLYLQCRA